MSESVNFPGARRAGAYVETDDVPEALPIQGAEVFVGGSEAIVEPDWEPAAEVPAAAPGTATHAGEAAKVSAPSPGVRTVSMPAPAEADDDHEPLKPATEGVRGFLNRVTAGALKLGPSAQEMDKRALAAAQDGFEALIRQSTWTRGIGILVANKKGTAGKTPVAISLGGVIAAIRGGSVAIGEAADDRGQLAYRAEGDPQLGMGELVANIATVRTQSQLRGYTVTQTSFASVIGSTPRWRAPLTRQNVLDVAAIVDEHFTVRVWDTGNQYSSGPFSAAVDTSDVLVIPTMNSMDSVFDALELLEFLKAQGGDAARLAGTAIVVRLSDGRPEFKASRVKKYFVDQGITEERIYSLPFDAHIAERGALTLAKLAPATRRALTAVAAGVVAQLNVNVFEKDQQNQMGEGEKR